MACIVGYFGFKVFYHGVVEFLDDQSLSAKAALLIQCTDVLFLGGTLLIFRARDWPMFFSVGLNEIANVRCHIT